MKINELEKELQRTYGAAEGTHVFRTVLPGILADFLKMYKKAAAGSTVQEDYHLEDGKGAVVLQCRKVSGVPGPIEAELRK
jgi:hypothetical protein